MAGLSICFQPCMEACIGGNIRDKCGCLSSYDYKTKDVNGMCVEETGNIYSVNLPQVL